jgi:hypothetical protein
LNMPVVRPYREIHVRSPLRGLDHISNIDGQIQGIRRKLEIFHGGVVSGLYCLS